MLNLIGIREALHKIPERGFCEYKTQEFLLSVLANLKQIKTHTFKKQTGILVEYSFGKGDYTLFRAEMDGLIIGENTNLSFQSKHNGMMHACGHDVHMTILIGLIQKVVEKRFERNLLFLFQPAEEDVSGAARIVDCGVLDQFPITHCYACHITSSLAVGEVSSKSGTLFAVPQEFDITILGKSAHAAKAHLGKNALLAASELALKISKLKGKNQVVNIGRLNCGTARNSIAALAKLFGTHRVLDEASSNRLSQKIRALCNLIADKYSVECSLTLGATTKPVLNNTKLLKEFRKKLPEGVKYVLAQPAFTADDFGVFTNIYPSVMFWLGCGKSAEDIHSDRFNPEISCIDVAIDIFSKLL